MKILSEITSHIFLFIVGVLALCATLTTCVIPISYIENPQNNVKYVALSLIPTAIIGCLLIKMQQVIRQITLQRIRVFALSMIAGIGLLWISVANLHPVWDMQALIDYASSFGDNDSLLFSDSYLHMYPYQSGYILFLYVFMNLFGFSNYLAVRVFNIVLVVLGIYFMSRLTGVIFPNDQIAEKNSLLISTLFSPFIFTATLIYGNLPSISFCLGACYFLLRVFRNRETIQISYGLLSIFFVFLALWFKPNSLIFLIGLIFYLLTEFVGRKKIKILILVIVNLCVYILASSLPVMMVENKHNVDISHNVLPKTAWIAMSLQNSYPRADGWYNDYAVNLYQKYNGDTQKIDSIAKKDIANRLRSFLHDPNEAINFMSNKITSQWSEPTFESLEIVFGSAETIPNNLSPDSKLQSSMHQGLLRRIYIMWCDSIQTLIYISSFILIIKLRKNLSMKQLLPAIIMMGGLLFHAFWEAKSLYVLPYFMLLIPYAATCFAYSVDWVENRGKRVSSV